MLRLLPLLLTIFIDSLGFGLVFPLLSPLVMDPENGILAQDVTVAVRGWIFGLLITGFCVGQFFGGPVLGAISDRVGRKKVLLVTLWIACASYVLSAFSIWVGSAWMLLLCRIFSGLAAGNFSVAQSMVVDNSEEKDKSKNFGLLGMAWGVGFILGPFVAGKISQPDFASWAGMTTPFLFAAVLCAINAAMLFSLAPDNSAGQSKRELSLMTGFLHLRQAFTHPELKGLFALMFLFSLGWGFFTEFSPLFLMRRLGFTPPDIANFYAYVGVCIALSQGLLIRPLIARFSPRVLLPAALISMACILPLMLLVDTAFGVFLILPFLAYAESLIFPSASTLVSKYSSKEAQGETFGIYNSVQWAAIGFAPIFSGSLVAQHPHLPVSVAACCMLMAFVLAWYIMVRKKNISTDPA